MFLNMIAEAKLCRLFDGDMLRVPVARKPVFSLDIRYPQSPTIAVSRVVSKILGPATSESVIGTKHPEACSIAKWRPLCR